MRGQEATEVIPASGERVAAAPRASKKWPVVAALALLVVGALAAGGYFYFLIPITFENKLLLPVKVVWGGHELDPVAPGGSFARKVKRGDSFPLQWYAALPTGAPPGEAVSGSVVFDRLSSGSTVVASAEGAKERMFAPLITNATGVTLKVTVNPGSAAATDCRCAVPDGGTRLGIGYYRLFQNSSVKVTAPDGRSATFPNVAGAVAAGSGSVGLRFEAKDLH